MSKHPSEEEVNTARGEEYGDFSAMCDVSDKIKAVFRESPNWPVLDPVYRECLDLFATKFARILVGNPNHVDSWFDIGGYARLATKRAKKLSGLVRPKQVNVSISGVADLAQNIIDMTKEYGPLKHGQLCIGCTSPEGFGMGPDSPCKGCMIRGPESYPSMYLT